MSLTEVEEASVREERKGGERTAVSAYYHSAYRSGVMATISTTITTTYSRSRAESGRTEVD